LEITAVEVKEVWEKRKGERGSSRGRSLLVEEMEELWKRAAGRSAAGSERREVTPEAQKKGAWLSPKA